MKIKSIVIHESKMIQRLSPYSLLSLVHFLCLSVDISRKKQQRLKSELTMTLTVHQICKPLQELETSNSIKVNHIIWGSELAIRISYYWNLEISFFYHRTFI